MKSLLIATAFIALPQARALHAQTPPPETVPREFMELLWLSPMPVPGQPQAAVGRLPEPVARVLRFGADARIVGSMNSPMLSVGAVIMAGAPAAARQRVVAQLVEAGWKEMTVRRPTEGGFEMMPRATDSAGLCSPEQQTVHVAAERHRGDSTVVTLMVVGRDFDSACNQPQPEPVRRAVEAPMPILRAPEGSQHRGGGVGGGGPDARATGRLRTELVAAALMAHYALQMVEQGWQPVTSALAEDVAIQLFHRLEDERVTWHAVLSVTLLPGGDKDLYLRLQQVRGR